MSDELGTDWDSFRMNEEGELDLDPAGGIVEGALAVAQSVARGWQTPQGSMPWAEAEGFALADWLNADLTTAEILAIGVGMEADASLDDRVQAISVTPTFDAAAGRLSIDASGTTAAGPFRLVLEGDALDVSVLQVTA